MPINQNSVKATIFKFLKTNGYSPTMLDSSGKEMAITDDADVFQFNFVKDNENYGTITIGIDGLGQLTLYFGDEVATSPAASSQDGMPSFHELTSRLRKLTFGKVSKFELSDMDNLKYDMAKRENTKKLDEGYYPMGKSGSYSDAVPTVKMVIKHTRKIEEGEQRYRNIAQIFIENSLGERVLAPTTKPGLARPFARHIAEGGLPNDDRWNHIKELCEDYTKMAGFVRATKNGQFNESTQQLVSEGTAHYVHLRETLHKMAGKRGYTEHFDNWSPTLVEDAAGTDLSEMFMNATLDPRIESAMPILAKISKNTSKMAEVDELSEWADQLVSERLAPKSIPQIDDLAKLLSNDIVVGPNAMYAKEMLASANLIDDELNAQLEELAERDSDANATDTIINWMEQSADHRMHSVLDKIEPAELGADVDESLRPGEHHGFEDDPITGTRVYKGIQGDQYQAPKKPHEWKDNDQARAQRQHDREEPKLSVAEDADPFSYGKPPRKGSVADLTAKKRKEQERGQQPIEPKDQQVGVAKVTKGVAEGSLNESDKFTSWYDWKDQAKSSGYTITKKDDKIVALNKQGQVVGHWSDVGKFLSGKAPRPNFKRPEEQGVAEGSESKDNLISTLNSFGYYTDDSRVYVNDDGDKIVRVGSEWKHQSGKRGRGAEELGDFLSSNQGVAEASMAPNARIDPQSTTQYGMKIVNALTQQFGDYFSYKMNQDGSFTVVQKKGSGPENQYDPRYENDPNVLTPQSISRVIDPYYNMFRQKGWRFDQPMGGEFTIAIPEDQAVSEDLEANQQRVGQLGPKAKHAKPGDLVGVDESTDQLAAMRRLSGLIK